MNRKLAILTCGLFFSTLIIIVLFIISEYNARNPNGFNRITPQHKIDYVDRFDIKHNSWYLAGRFDNKVLLRNSKVFNKLLTIDFSLKDTGLMTLSWPDSLRVFNGSNIVMDSPMVYLMDGVTPNIFSENLETRQIVSLSGIPFFTNGLPVSTTSFLLRSVDNLNNNYFLKCGNGISSFTPKKNILTNQIDGLFSTDGTFSQVPGTSKFVYTYFYRDQFLYLDSNLKIIFEGRTIDTITQAHIKVSGKPSDGQITMSAPPLFVNKEVCTTRDWLFIHSLLKADNETELEFRKMSVVDIYSLQNGKYAFSVYIPDFRGFKIRDMKVFDNSLFVLIDHFIYKFKLNF